LEQVIKAENICSSFIILSGVEKNQGVVIDKFHSRANTIRTLDVDNGIWFLV